MNERRIFVAIDISQTVRTACGRHIDNLRNSYPDVRVGWENLEKLHITMKFLGNTDAPLYGELQTGLAEIAAKHSPFSLRISRPGVFPRASRPRVLWIGLDDRPGAVMPLYAELENLCEKLGYARELKAFRPHITIGRVRDPDKASALAEAHLRAKLEPVEFEVSDIVIYESNLQPTGSVYSVLSTAKLGTSI
jgi:2'-5' RNA ligase